MGKKMQKIKVKDYGDPWVNRLAVVDLAFQQMDEAERAAMLNWLRSKYPIGIRALKGGDE